MKQFVQRPTQGRIVLICYPAGFGRPCIVEECDADFRVTGAEIHAGLSVGLVIASKIPHVLDPSRPPSSPGWQWPPRVGIEDGRWF